MDQSCGGVYGEDDRRFIFNSALVGIKSKARFKISNIKKVAVFSLSWINHSVSKVVEDVTLWSVDFLSVFTEWQQWRRTVGFSSSISERVVLAFVHHYVDVILNAFFFFFFFEED